MFSLFLHFSHALPDITDGVYFDISFKKKKLGRIELGLCRKACPNSVQTIIKGCKCTESGFCYKGTNITDFRVNSHFVIGSSFSSKGSGNDPISGPNDQSYLVLASGTGGKASGKITVTLSSQHETDKSSNPVGKLISGLSVIRKIAQITGSDEDDPPEVQISGCGVLSSVYDNDDIDL